MTDEQKLNIIKQEWKHAANSWGSVADFKNFLDNITKQKVILFLKAQIQHEVDKYSSAAQSTSDTAQNLATFKDELDIYLS